MISATMRSGGPSTDTVTEFSSGPGDSRSPNWLYLRPPPSAQASAEDVRKRIAKIREWAARPTPRVRD
jgi:hypothetical protein